MRIVLTVVGGLLMFVGTIWFLQGIGVLPGSFMTGQTKWALIGGSAFCVGIAVLAFARRGAVPHRTTGGRTHDP